MNIIALPSTPFAALPTGHSRSDREARVTPAVDLSGKKHGIFSVNLSGVASMLNPFILWRQRPRQRRLRFAWRMRMLRMGCQHLDDQARDCCGWPLKTSQPLSPTAVPEDGNGSDNYQ